MDLHFSWIKFEASFLTYKWQSRHPPSKISLSSQVIESKTELFNNIYMLPCFNIQTADEPFA